LTLQYNRTGWWGSPVWVMAMGCFAVTARKFGEHRVLGQAPLQLHLSLVDRPGRKVPLAGLCGATSSTKCVSRWKHQ